MILRRTSANVENALTQLFGHATRSGLTILGIVIAVASTIVMVSAVGGFTEYVNDFFETFGTNALWVWPENQVAGVTVNNKKAAMTEADVRAVADNVQTLRYVSPLLRRESQAVSYNERDVKSWIEATDARYLAIRDFKIISGRAFSTIDIERGHYVCLLGAETARRLGTGPDIVGQFITIDGRRFRVIGLLSTKGAFMGVSQDDVVHIPFRLGLKLYPASRDAVVITAQAENEGVIHEAKSQIVRLLRRRHRIAPEELEDFRIASQDEVLATFRKISLGATVTLAGVVGVSLLVGGIGIMNVMLVSVTERTREIGLRKALGARRRDILGQFLTEAVLLSLLGGLIGTLIGWGCCQIASHHPKMVPIGVPWWAVTLGFGVSAITGVVFGLIPAIKAALLNPIDALRHE
jgi:putative ABC transport system permease protein